MLILALFACQTTPEDAPDAEAAAVAPLATLEHDAGTVEVFELAPGQLVWGEVAEVGGALLTPAVLSAHPVSIWRGLAPQVEVPEALLDAVERARRPDTGELPWDETSFAAIAMDGAVWNVDTDCAPWIYVDPDELEGQFDLLATSDEWAEMEDIDGAESRVCGVGGGTVAHRLWTKDSWYSSWSKVWDQDVGYYQESRVYVAYGWGDYDHVWTGVYDRDGYGWDGEWADLVGTFWDD